MDAAGKDKASAGPDNSPLLTLDELAAMLRVSRKTVYNHLTAGPPDGSQDGDIRMIRQKRIGGRRFFLRSSVEAFLK